MSVLTRVDPRYPLRLLDLPRPPEPLWWEGDVTLLSREVHHLTRAADRAKATFANEEALALYRAAIAQLTTSDAHPPGLAAALQEGTGEVLLRVARTDDSVTAFQAALDHVPPEDRLGRARLLRKAGAALHIGRRHPEAFAAYDGALESLGAPPDPDADAEWWHEWLDIKLARCYLHYFSMELAPQAAILEEVRAVVARHGTAQRRALYHRGRALMALRRDRFTASDAAIADARAAIAAWNESGDPTDRETVHFTLGYLHLWRSELTDAERWLGVSAAAGERAGDIVLLSRCWTYLTIASRRRGDETATLDYARRAAAHARAGMVEYVAVGEGNLAWLSWRHGELDELRAHAEASLGDFAQFPVRHPCEWVVRLPLLAAALEKGDPLDAVTQARELLDPTQQFLGADLERALVGPVAAADALFAADAVETSGIAGQALRDEISVLVERVIVRRFASRPAVVCCDDLHWSDPSSVDLLVRAFAAAERVPVLFLCTFRPGRQSPAWRLRQTVETDLPHPTTARRHRPRHSRGVRGEGGLRAAPARSGL